MNPAGSTALMEEAHKISCNVEIEMNEQQQQQQQQNYHHQHLHNFEQNHHYHPQDLTPDDHDPFTTDYIFKASTVETATQSLHSIIQFHFQKTIEKKRAIDSQKKELWKLFSCFFIFLSIVFVGIVSSSNSRLECRHCWAPIALCLLAHTMLYISTAQTLRCLNGLKFQRHCHKLTLGVAATKLNRLRRLPSSVLTVPSQEFEVPYQEPGPPYYAKFMKRWLLYSAFLLLTLCTMAAAVAAILCF